MKKLILVLVMALIVAPSFGALSVSLVKNGDNTVSLNYTASSTAAADMPRAFAFTIAISGGAEVNSITTYKTGESTSSSKGFGIYPATIDINSTTGNVTAWGTPMAATGDPGAGDQVLPSTSFVVEFGSLYVGDGNKPATSGTLCKFTVKCNGATAPVVTAVEEDTYRGGVVMEDGTAATVTVAPLTLTGVCGCTMPGAAAQTSPANAASVSTASQNLTWTAGSTATGYDVYLDTVNPPVVKVSSNQAGLTKATGVLVRNTTYYWRVDSINACGTTTGTVRSFTTECFPASYTTYADWVTYGRPACWCSKYQCDGDADGITSGSPFNYRVYNGDLNLITSNWKKKMADYPATLNPCADVDHKSSGSPFFYRVYNGDLNKITTNWKKKDTGTGALPGDCPRAE